MGICVSVQSTPHTRPPLGTNKIKLQALTERFGMPYYAINDGEFVGPWEQTHYDEIFNIVHGFHKKAQWLNVQSNKGGRQLKGWHDNKFRSGHSPAIVTVLNYLETQGFEVVSVTQGMDGMNHCYNLLLRKNNTSTQ